MLSDRKILFGILTTRERDRLRDRDTETEKQKFNTILLII